VSIVPEVDGTVVDRLQARAVITGLLQNLQPGQAELPVKTRIASVRAADLEPARALLARAISHPLQVSSDGGSWTLSGGEIGQFVDQKVTAAQNGAPSIALSLDRDKLAPWLADRLAAQINRDPVDAVVGWNGERVVSVEQSVDGVRLDAAKLAEEVEGRFFGDGGTITAPVTYIKPKIDSGNLGALGITTLLGSGQSNYSGSNDGRATNVATGARLLNGTLIPPWGEFSFNGAIGLIDEEKGFVEAQVIDGENIGQDIGGGICQVSTTVFRAAYLAGMPITEWWPHRFRIGFYEYDGWKPGLDASILQPTTDPATWADFKFENPSDSWMLVESWTDGVNVVVNIYGADLGYQVDTTGPTWGAKTQMLQPSEVVDDKLDPGTIEEVQIGGIGEELSHYRVVRDRNGQVLWEGNFYTKYFPRGEVWKVSADMKGQAPIDKNFKAPPLPPAGIDSHNWTPGMDLSQLPTTATEGAIWTSG
jgi:vancomycin resistance protein YoaR